MTEDSNALAPPPSAASIKAVIAQFLTERLEPKLAKVTDDNSEQRAALLAAYAPENWIASAARRVGQIQQVTHAIKYTHPDACGSSLYSTGNPLATDSEVGTHTLGAALAADVVGTAAALDVYKFLNLRIGEQSILELAVADEPALLEAFSENAEEARLWMQSFAALTESRGQLTSHKLAKQIYWPLGNDSYHLLSPLFPTSLAHTAWEKIRADTELAWNVRKSKKNGNTTLTPFSDYPDLLIQKFGGSNPQNISQLNANRGSKNYLLPALPPNWQSPAIRPPLAVKSIFDRIFSKRPKVKELTRSLRDFLEFQERKKIAILLKQSLPKYRDEPISERLSRIPHEVLVSAEQQVNNQGIRAMRQGLTQSICDEVLLYAAELREAIEDGKLAAGWTRDEACQLNRAEQLWLDPLRARDDTDFASDYQRDEWRDEICRLFGNWLNRRLSTKHTRMSVVEAEHWRGELEKEMRLLRRELADHE